MQTRYVQAAMRRAKHEILEEDGSFYGSIPGLQGVWVNADTLEECREELESVLEGWLWLGVSLHDPIPAIDGIEIRVPAESI